MPFHAPTFIAPLRKLIPEITDALVDATFIVPPINALPVIPNPPVTVNAPVVVLDEFAKLVKANPEAVTKPVFGFTTNDVIVDKPNPELLEVLTAVTKNDAATVVGATATEDAADGGTACQVGAAPVPLEVRTCPEVEEVAYLDQVVAVFATIKSPIAVGPCNPVPP